LVHDDSTFERKLPPEYDRVDYSVIPGNQHPELTAMSRIKRPYSLDKIPLLPGGTGRNDFNIRIASGQFKCIRRRMGRLIGGIRAIKKKSNSQRSNNLFPLLYSSGGLFRDPCLRPAGRVNLQHSDQI